MFRKINYYGYKETIMYLVGSEQSGSQWRGASLKRSHVFDENLRTTLTESGTELSTRRFRSMRWKGLLKVPHTVVMVTVKGVNKRLVGKNKVNQIIKIKIVMKRHGSSSEDPGCCRTIFIHCKCIYYSHWLIRIWLA